MMSGVHGSAWTAVVKDTSILLVVLFLGTYLPLHYYGSNTAMFQAIQTAKPDFLALPVQGESIARFDSTALLTALGFYVLAAYIRVAVHREGGTSFPPQRCPALAYQIILLFVFFVGSAAILKVPGQKVSEIDLSLLSLSVQTFDPWFVAVIGAAVVLTAIGPGSMILMASEGCCRTIFCATFARNPAT